MKKLVSILLLTCICATFLSACSNRPRNDYNSNLNSTVKIVYPDGTEESCVFNEREKNQITPKYENGKILVGYYSSESATGIEYINYKGTSVEWSYSYPSILYAVYEEADYSKKYTSKVLKDENPVRVMYYQGDTFTFDSFANSENASSDLEDFAKLLHSNPTAEIRITMHATVKNYYDTSKTAKLGVEIGVDKLNTSETSSNSTSYKAISVTTTIKAKQLISGTNAIVARVYPSVYVKNIYYTAEFVAGDSN